MVICHGDFLNADHDYIHENKSVKGFGSYGDIMLRDRKMYVAPTPFAFTEGTTGLITLILSDNISSKKIKNNNVGKEHKFKAYRLKEQSDKKVRLLKHNREI
jgi:hypothetical protein